MTAGITGEYREYSNMEKAHLHSAQTVAAIYLKDFNQTPTINTCNELSYAIIDTVSTSLVIISCMGLLMSIA